MGITKQQQLEERDADLELMRDLRDAAGEAGHGLSPWGADFVEKHGTRLEAIEEHGGRFFFDAWQRGKAEELLEECRGAGARS